MGFESIVRFSSLCAWDCLRCRMLFLLLRTRRTSRDTAGRVESAYFRKTDRSNPDRSRSRDAGADCTEFLDPANSDCKGFGTAFCSLAAAGLVSRSVSADARRSRSGDARSGDQSSGGVNHFNFAQRRDLHCFLSPASRTTDGRNRSFPEEAEPRFTRA